MSLLEPLCQALNRADVRYVVVAGVATVLHGFARLTADVDLVVDLAPTAPTSPVPPREADRDAGWESHRRRQLTFALAATPAERLRWLEEMYSR